MVTHAVRRQLSRAVSQLALRPRARYNVLKTRERAGTQCDATCKPQTVQCCVYRKGIKGSTLHAVRHKEAPVSWTHRVLLCIEKKKCYQLVATVSFVPSNFSYFSSASPAHSQQLFILFACLSYSVEQEKSCRQHCLKW